MTKEIRIGDVRIGAGNPLALIAGPCVLEDEKSALKEAVELKKITQRCGVPFVFKSSYCKGNRTRLNDYKGPGLKKGLNILKKIKETVGVPVLSDVHCRSEIKDASKVLDVIQIPAFLCKQTDLMICAGETGKVINIKKGQFLDPNRIKDAVEKIESTGNKKILLTERGTFFGYSDLVVDFRSLIIMAKTGYPVIFDVTHTVKNPSLASAESDSGSPEFINGLARGAVGVGIDGLFVEVHPCPEKAKCDSSSMMKLSNLEILLMELKKIDSIVKKKR